MPLTTPKHRRTIATLYEDVRALTTRVDNLAIDNAAIIKRIDETIAKIDRHLLLRNTLTVK